MVPRFVAGMELLLRVNGDAWNPASREERLRKKGRLELKPAAVMVILSGAAVLGDLQWMDVQIAVFRMI